MAKVKNPPFPPLSLPLRIVKLHAKLAIAILIASLLPLPWRRLRCNGERASWPDGT
jgi:hypothetical protein